MARSAGRILQLLVVVASISSFSIAETLDTRYDHLAGPPPAIPSSGAYLGAWINPKNLPGYSGIYEIQQLPDYNNLIGVPAAILHVYKVFHSPFPRETLWAVERNGSIPLVDWHCTDLNQILSGYDDTTIVRWAQLFRQFHHPVFLRWYWEMNLATPHSVYCNAYHNGPKFIASWIHIWNIFKKVGATNVAFVWCPSGHGVTAQYYPGDAYVDWIGIDRYDRHALGANGFDANFAQFYAEWSVHNKPMMVGETGATSVDQAAYITGIQQDAPAKFPQFKAIMYFDAPKESGDWTLSGTGVTAFQTLALQPYFSYHQTLP